MNLTVLGAAGVTGIPLLEQALAADHHVTALVRSGQKLSITNPNLHVVEGDATARSVVSEAMKGAEEVPLERENGRGSMATMGDGRLVVRGEDEQASRAIERWYRREARRRIEQVAVHEAARLGLAYHSLGIRDPRTRWGSCSRRGHLSFSWRLAAAPPDVLRYVVVHELCHLREPSHSKAFWRLLEAARPGWQEQARWLREHGEELHDFTLRAALTS